ncbi:MAG: hypothetical protein ONB24_12245 [candidate division KSB1 bacterium]|nr:hypothetical protein [candidate division KSB1 bacterium]
MSAMSNRGHTRLRSLEFSIGNTTRAAFPADDSQRNHKLISFHPCSNEQTNIGNFAEKTKDYS